jgi:Na+/melibiose symporter-like transporter
VFPAAIACGCLVLIRGRVGLEKLTTNNEVAGFKFAVVGVIYAVLLAFAVIVVWERYTEAEVAVVQEAGAAATIYRLAAGNQPDAEATREAVSNYLRLAITHDWPLMAREEESADVTRALDTLYTSALNLTPNEPQQAAITLELFNQLDTITKARRARLHLSVGIVPGVLWTALAIGGILTVAFTFFFGTENLRAQVLMTGILAVIVFLGLFVIVTIDHPFTGPVHVSSAPLLHVLEDFARR